MSFTAEVEDWVFEQEGLFEAIFKQSSLDVLMEAQKRIPVDTGFARASVMASTCQFPGINAKAVPGKDAVRGAYVYDSAQIVSTVAGMSLGQTLYIGWTAAYADVLEYGHSKQAPNGFVRLAAQQWPAIVARNLESVRPKE